MEGEVLVFPNARCLGLGAVEDELWDIYSRVPSIGRQLETLLGCSVPRSQVHCQE